MTTAKQARTPGPWQAIGASITAPNERVVNIGPRNRPVNFRIASLKDGSLQEVQANAQFIVRACNEYDADKATIAELVAALRECITDSGAHCYRAGTASAFDARLCAINETVRLALAKIDNKGE